MLRLVKLGGFVGILVANTPSINDSERGDELNAKEKTSTLVTNPDDSIWSRYVSLRLRDLIGQLSPSLC